MCVRHAIYGANLAHLYRKRRDLTSDMQSRNSRIPAAPSICFPRDANYCTTRSGAGRKHRRASRRFSETSRVTAHSPGPTCCSLQYSGIAKLISIKRSFSRRLELFGISHGLSPRIFRILMSGGICVELRENRCRMAADSPNQSISPAPGQCSI